MPDAAHLVGGQAEILPRVFFGDVGDAQGLVKVLELSLVRWEVPTFLVPCNVWCWASRGIKQETKGSSLNASPKSAWHPNILTADLDPGGRCILSKNWAFLFREGCLATGSPQKASARILRDLMHL